MSFSWELSGNNFFPIFECHRIVIFRVRLIEIIENVFSVFNTWKFLILSVKKVKDTSYHHY